MRYAALAVLLVACASAPPSAWRGRSIDGAHRAELSEVEGGARLVLDGREVGVFSAVALADSAWTAAGLAIPVRQGNRWRVLRAGALGRAWDGIAELQVLEGRLIFAALDEEGWRLVVEGEPGPAHESIRAGSVVVERGHVAYVARDGGRERAVVDGIVGPAFRHVARLGFAGKGELVAYVGVEEEGARVVVDGEPQSRFDRVHELALSPDEPRWASMVELRGTLWLVHPEGAGGIGRGARSLVISRDGSHLAWIARHDGGDRVVLDHRAVGDAAHVSELSFDPAAEALVYVAHEEGGVRVVHAGGAGPRFESLEGPVVGRRHWGYVGHRAAGSAVVVDGAPVFRGGWAGSLRFAGERFAYVVRRGARRWVRTPDGEFEVPRPFVDSLTLSDDGEHWAIAVADVEAHTLRIWVDGRDAAELDMEALAGALAQGTDGGDATRALVRRTLDASE